MRLANFQIPKLPFSIELVGLGFVWDLHNAGEFLQLIFDPKTDVVTMTWAVRGDPSSKYSGCKLVFDHVKLLTISQGDPEVPHSEDLTISAISTVTPDSKTEPKYRIERQSEPNALFNLLFEFQSGRWIEIGAEAVRLEGIL